MHAQTILQLYRQLLDSGYDDPALAQVRAAYELACQLFVGCHRPNEKPFCAHLVGTASALARWGEPVEVVAAGLLHSAYLYGEFGDRSRGVSRAKKQVLQSRVGERTEALVERYTASTTQHDSIFNPAPCGMHSRDTIVMKLADLFDECADAGPLFSPSKALAGGLPHDPTTRQQVLAVAEELVGPMARMDLARVFQELASCRVPGVLVNQRVAYHTIQPGVPELRISRTRRRLQRLAHLFSM